ncbi:MAG: gliding motility-associated C-terminal domain-containing protein [Bacteroidetes bacterium]|nr:gliding motility-associated C-terminal domain-containing protein [Bacteroidota bacterium]
MRRILLSLGIFFLFTESHAQLQSRTVTIPCTTQCFTLLDTIPDIRNTDDYVVNSIPYSPFAYITAAPPLVHPCANNQDDKFFDTSYLPFSFCFYGNRYTKFVVGTNGVISFDSSLALLGNNYILDGTQIPDPNGSGSFGSGTCPFPNGRYYPKAGIFGVFHDIYPDPNDPNYKIEYRVQGTSPNRIAIISFYNVKLFDCQNNNNRSTSEIVLYEGTGLIDIYIERKGTCGNSGNSSRGIVGMQDMTRLKAVAAPNRNCVPFSAFQEAWRFTPSNGTPLYIRSELYKNGTLIATGDTTSIGNLQFQNFYNNVCQAEDSMTYVLKAFYHQCGDPTQETVVTDTIIVKKTLGPVTATTTATVCMGSSDGTITVTDPLGPTLEYSIDNGTNWQSSPQFSAAAGTYTVMARVVGSNCGNSTLVTVTQPPRFDINGTVQNATCNGSPNGQVNFAPSGTNTPYLYSADGGTTYQSTSTFTGLAAGSHTFRIKSSLGCTEDTTIAVTEPTKITATAVQLQPAGCSNNDGQISITAGGGTPGYLYSIDGSSFQSSNIITGLTVGAYPQITVKDANGCLMTANTTNVILNDQMFLNAGTDTTICFGSSVTLQPVTNPETSVFKWTPASGLSADNIKNPSASPADTTSYILAAQWGVCSRTDTVVVKVLHKPVAYAGKDTSICYKTIALLHGSAGNLSGTVNFAWAPAANVNPANAAVAIANADTTQLYTLTVTDNYGCNFSVTDDVLITMRPPVPAFAGNDTIAVWGIPHQMHASGGTYYQWTPSSPLDNPFSPTPLATLFADTYFTVLVTDDIGCSKSDDIFIKVYKGPTYYIPNAFTPNGDGLNDVFRPTPVGIAFTEYFNVYNRNGEMVFQTNQWLKGWDGTYKGKKADQGTYVWIIRGFDREGKVVEMKGTVLLLR